MTTVIVWNNNVVKLTGHTYPGHVAISICDNWSSRPHLDDYVSWWPVSEKDNRRDPNPNFLEDLKSEGYAPDHVINVPNLNTRKMQAEWEQILMTVRRYGFLRCNCSTIAARVLKAGSSAGGVMLRNNVIWTPLKVKRLALAMGGKKMLYTTVLSEMQRAGAITANERQALSTLAKRDERHGRNSATPKAYFVKGERVQPKNIVVLEGKGLQFFGSGAPQESGRANIVTVSATDVLQHGSGQVVNGDFQFDMAN